MPAAAPKPLVYSVDEKVYCYHGDILYEAKIIDTRRSDPDDKKSPLQYLVHYKGWKKSWDDWVMDDRMRKFNDENKELANTLRRVFTERQRNNAKGKKRGISEVSSNLDSDDLPSSTAGRKKAYQDLETEEEHRRRPKGLSIVMPDIIRTLLVDDWEYITKDHTLVPLPAKKSANWILDEYWNSEKVNREPGSQDEYFLTAFISTIKKFLKVGTGKFLLYSFEFEQYEDLSKLWNEPEDEAWQGKGPGDVYGVEHLCRLICSFPENHLTNDYLFPPDSIPKYLEELSRLNVWISRRTNELFIGTYEGPGNDYIERVSKRTHNNPPGNRGY